MRDNLPTNSWPRHEVTMLPTYLPHFLTRNLLEENSGFSGGINAYLQHKFSLFAKRPLG